jgi:DNA (cytosine-5)-methyltransferase 1
MARMRYGSLFAGIGGIDLGLERAGMDCIWQVENDPYAVRVLDKHWPKVRRCGDIREIDWSEVERPDLICGGFPCQPVSCAGKRLVQEDDRWLWPEFVRCLRELRPRFVFVENVPGLLVRGMGNVLGDLAAIGYDAEWESLPAAAFGAPHLRYRVFIVGYAKRGGFSSTSTESQGAVLRSRAETSTSSGIQSDVADAECGFLARRACEGSEGLSRVGERQWAVEPDVGRVAHGVPSRVDRLRCLGNAVVPQVAEWIGRRIVEAYG